MIVGAAAVLAACAGGERATTSDGFPTAAAEEVFAAGFGTITAKYLEPVSAATLALDGLRGLGAIDPQLTAALEDGEVVLYHDGHPIARTPAPGGGDSHGWAHLVAGMNAAARQYSAETRTAAPEKIYEAVFDGALVSLDVFSRYAGADEANRNRARRDGYGGIGVRFRLGDGGVRVVAVIPDSPADRSGILRNDRITHIGGAPVEGMSNQNLLRHLHGPVNSRIALTIMRDDHEAPLQFDLERAFLVPPSVQSEVRDGVVFLRITTFNQETAHGLETKLLKARAELGPAFKGVVLDLRGNPGGLLRQATKIADLFLAQGRILSTRGRHPDSIQQYEASGRDLADGMPIAVLIDGKSASAAEIVAAALQDRERAVVVGTASYGKGTVQTVIRLPNEGELTLTWSRLVAPSGYAIHGAGVPPHVCTSGLGAAGEAAIAEALARRGAIAATHAAWRRVDPADEKRRQELRAACPAETEDDAPLPRAVATRLVNDRVLWRSAFSAPGATAEARLP